MVILDGIGLICSTNFKSLVLLIKVKSLNFYVFFILLNPSMIMFIILCTVNP